LTKKTSIFNNVAKQFLIHTIVAIIVGVISAFFLISLDFVGKTREENSWIIAILPLAGFLIGLGYYYFGKGVEKGNNLIFDEFFNPKQKIPAKKGPMELVGALITHLFGGSAGREGVAVQMGVTISDRFSKATDLKNVNRKTLLLIGISAGFASIFGTPIAGAIFAIEMLFLSLKEMKWMYVIACFYTAFLADFTCSVLGVGHTKFIIEKFPEINFQTLFWVIVSGLIFGLVAFLYVFLEKTLKKLFSYVKFPPLRPFIGGGIIVLLVYILGTTKHIGLGISTIETAFTEELFHFDFLIKILLTTLTLSAGFKGGSVTPLFFIGATLGNALFIFIPLPIGLLAGIGFVAVFSGATKTPIACCLMGIELFGIESVIYVVFACFTAFFASGRKSIYGNQSGESRKHLFWRKKISFLPHSKL
jgi:H+/Cl- antiporter ClcA